MLKIIPQPIKFEWDAGNKNKNFSKHQVLNEEAEQVFFDSRKRYVGALDFFGEDRHILLGRTKDGRKLFVVFTVRRDKVRIISARDLNRKERKLL